MRAAPAVAVEARPDGVSRRALVLLAVAGGLVAGVWALQRGDGAGGIVLTLVLIGLAAVVRSVLGMPTRWLRWDGQVWHLGEAGRAAQQPATGQVAAALDLGDWMLLRFDPQGRSAWDRGRCWLPLNRRSLEPQWHALRCAVYGPRPAPDAATPLADA